MPRKAAPEPAKDVTEDDLSYVRNWLLSPVLIIPIGQEAAFQRCQLTPMREKLLTWREKASSKSIVNLMRGWFEVLN
jgi:hypothetical protein